MNALFERTRPPCLNTPWERGAGLIWAAGETLFFENPRNRFMRFRRRLHLDFAPVSAELRVFADTHYRLAINGVLRGRGPSRSDPTWTYYDRYEAASFLSRGDNTIALLVLFQGFGTGARISIMQGLLFQLTIRGSGGECVVVVSDESWMASPAEEFARPTPRLHGPLGCIEVQDTRLAEAGWADPGFDDSSWGRTGYVKSFLPISPWYHFVECPLPRRDEAEIESQPRVRVARGPCPAPPIDLLGQIRVFPLPVSVERPEQPLTLAQAPAADEAHVITVDFGRIENGFLKLEVEGAAGTIIDALVSDSLAPGDIVPKPEAARILTSRWILRGGRQTLEVAFNWLAFRHVQLWVWTSGPFTLHRVRMRTLYYPLPAVRGFECDDDLLTRLDAVCAHGIRLCYQDAIVDSPSREQQQWIGDARKTAIFNHHRWGDAKLHRNLIEQIGQGMDWTGSMVPRYPSGNRNVTPIPSYSLDWIGSFEDYHRYTGDDSLLADWWPNLLLAIRWFSAFENDDGLLERVPHWIYIDLGEGPGGRGLGVGEIHTALNLQYLAALRAIVAYAGRLGEQSAAAWFDGKAARLADAIREKLWNGRAYADARTGLRLTEGCSEVVAAHALLHLEPPGGERAAFILREAFEAGSAAVPSSPFSMHVVFQALRLHSQEARALDLIRARYAPWLAAGATAPWEHWTVFHKHDGAGYPHCASSCHAWGAAPLAFFVGAILGIRPTAPGWLEVEIRPFSGDLARASGACLTPRGLIEVSWTRTTPGGGGRFSLSVSVPSDTRGEIVMPDGASLPLRSGDFSCDLAS